MARLDHRPASTEERFHLLDTLRAIALLGVIIFNVVGMSAAFVADTLFPKATPLDQAFLLFDLRRVLAFRLSLRPGGMDLALHHLRRDAADATPLDCGHRSHERSLS